MKKFTIFSLLLAAFFSFVAFRFWGGVKEEKEEKKEVAAGEKVEAIREELASPAREEAGPVSEEVILSEGEVPKKLLTQEEAEKMKEELEILERTLKAVEAVRGATEAARSVRVPQVSYLPSGSGTAPPQGIPKRLVPQLPDVPLSTSPQAPSPIPKVSELPSAPELQGVANAQRLSMIYHELRALREALEEIEKEKKEREERLKQLEAMRRELEESLREREKKETAGEPEKS